MTEITGPRRRKWPVHPQTLPNTTKSQPFDKLTRPTAQRLNGAQMALAVLSTHLGTRHPTRPPRPRPRYINNKWTLQEKAFNKRKYKYPARKICGAGFVWLGLQNRPANDKQRHKPLRIILGSALHAQGVSAFLRRVKPFLLRALAWRIARREGSVGVGASVAQAQQQITARHHSNLPEQNKVWTCSRRPKPARARPAYSS